MKLTQKITWHRGTKRRRAMAAWTWLRLTLRKIRAAERALPSISKVNLARRRNHISFSTISGHSMKRTEIRLLQLPQRRLSKKKAQLSLTLMKLALCPLPSLLQRRNLGINQINHLCITMQQISKRVLHKEMKINSLDQISWTKDPVPGIE